MNKEELAPWIERLAAEPDGKKRNGIVAELCKEKGLKIGDAWKLIKEAGFDPKAVAGNSEGAETAAEPVSAASAQTETPAKAETETEAEKDQEDKTGEETAPALLRHKTPYPKYRCAALVLTQKPETYWVSESQLEKLRRDPWVVIEKEAAPE